MTISVSLLYRLSWSHDDGGSQISVDYTVQKRVSTIGLRLTSQPAAMSLIGRNDEQAARFGHVFDKSD